MKFRLVRPALRPTGRNAARAWLALWFLTAALAGLGAPAARAFVLRRSLGAPAWPHALGFDAFGRDLGLLILHGSLVSAAFAMLATFAALATGLALGSALSLLPARARAAADSALDGILAFPYLIFALAWALLYGPGWTTLLVAIWIASAPAFTRLVDARAREILADDYVEAARALGAGPWSIARKHLLPGTLPLGAIKLPNLFAGSLMAEAALSFLGLGAPLGEDTWGALLLQGRDYLLEAPHIAISAGAPLFLTVLALQLFFGKPGRKTL